MQVTMIIGDLVMVTKSYTWKIYCILPERIVEREIKAGTVGIVVDVKSGFVWIASYDDAYQVQKKHLRVIGKSTLKQFYGYSCVDWGETVGGSHGIWLNKDVMTLAKGETLCK